MAAGSHGCRMRRFVAVPPVCVERVGGCYQTSIRVAYPLDDGSELGRGASDARQIRHNEDAGLMPADPFERIRKPRTPERFATCGLAFMDDLDQLETALFAFARYDFSLLFELPRRGAAPTRAACVTERSHRDVGNVPDVACWGPQAHRARESRRGAEW